MDTATDCTPVVDVHAHARRPNSSACTLTGGHGRRGDVLGNGVSRECRQCRQNLFPAFILFPAFTTISKAALSPITIAVAIYSSHIRVIFPCFAATPMPLVIRSSHLPTLYTCCPPSNRLFRCHHRFLPPAPLRSLLHGCSPPRRCPPSRGQCHRRGRCPCFPPSLLRRKLEAISKAQ